MRSLQRRVTHAAVASATLCAMLVSAPTSASAAPVVRKVPGDYPTIQAGIDAAVNGDSVLVAPGTYVENLDFHGKAVVVTSSDGPTVTLIDGSGRDPVALFDSGETRASALDGFTLEHGNAVGHAPSFADEGGGVAIVNSSPTIENNIIQDNQADLGGGGVGIRSGSPLLRNNLIRANRPGPGSGGIGGGGLSISGGSAKVVGNVIEHNTWSLGGGVTLFAAGTPVLRNNIIRANVAYHGQGGGVWAVNQSDGLFAQNLVVDNTATEEGGGVYWSVPFTTRGPYLINNTVAGNSAPAGAAVSLSGFDAEALATNNVFVGNGGSSVFDCGTFPGLPHIRFNNVWSSGGTPRYGGNCTDQTGVNGNISADPLLVDPTVGDYHLHDGSPSIDAGDNAAPGLTLTDLDGNPRIVGAAVDQGVYEAQSGADLALGLTASPNPVKTGKLLTWTLTATNAHLNAAWPNSLSGGVQFHRVTTSAGSCLWARGTSLTCSLGTLATGASAVITIVVQPGGPGVLTNTATITANEFDPNPADNTASVQVTVRAA